ncbi:MAG: protein phosphatase 2C domain-containing protein [Verrucomicrobiae bacterium]|nr:protein phosphatase 2C domain-containing protein [Verrucomicrobiae bacterium]
MSPPYFESTELSDVGRKRKNNEDACLRIPERGVFCVADGMGGQAGGDLASETIITTIQEIFTKAGADDDNSLAKRIALFRKSANEASRWIKNFSEEKAVGQMGSTLVGLVFDPRSPTRAVALHAGDSRLYCHRNNDLKQITADHSAVAALAAKLGVDPSTIPAKYQNELSRAVGLSETVELEKTPVTVCSGDVYLICSDGLSRMLPDPVIAKILADGAQDPIEATAKKLVAAANEAGGKDNVTVVLVKIGDLTNAPKAVVEEDEAEEGKTVAAPDTPANTPRPSGDNTPSKKPDTHDSTDIHGDTPTTPVTNNAALHAPQSKDGSTPAKPGQPVFEPPDPKRKLFVLRVAAIVIATLLAVGTGVYLIFFYKPAEPPSSTADFPPLPKAPAAGTVKPGPDTLPAVQTSPVPATNNAAAQNPNLAAWQLAMQNAQTAFAKRDYKLAAAQADEALQKIPGEATAAKLKADAVAQSKIIEAWRQALANAQTAYDNHDYNTAVVQATEAVRIIPGEQTAGKLLENARQRVAENEVEVKYQTALQAGQAAFKQNNFMLAEAKAKEALVIKPNDPAAAQILQQINSAIDLSSARRFFNQGDYDTALQSCSTHPDAPEFTQLAAACRTEQAALQQAQTQLKTGDYSLVKSLPAQPFAAKPPFAALLAQATNEQQILLGLQALKQTNTWQALAAKLKDPALADLTNKPPFSVLVKWAGDIKTLQDANVAYEKLLVWFNVKKPSDHYLLTAEARKETRLDGALPEKQRQDYLATVKQLEDIFRRAGCLTQGGRAANLKQLAENITHHD